MRISLQSINGVELSMDGRIDLGYLGDSLHSGGQLRPLRSERLAVSAPRSIEFKKPSLIGFIDGGFEVVGIKHDDVLLRGSTVFVLLRQDKGREGQGQE